jgi:hypothetical protein
MSRDIEQTLRNLEALALRPGTPEEGELARARAIEHATKYKLSSIFTQPDFKPPTYQRPTTSQPKKPKLHKNVVAMEDRLQQDGWFYQGFSNNTRTYKNSRRPDEEIRMTAHWFGTFSCMHVYKPSNSTRPAGNDANELDHFFKSMPYRYELWPRPATRRSSYTDFYDPLLDEFDPLYGQSEPSQTIHEEAKAPEPPKAPETPPAPPEPPEDPIDVRDRIIAEMIRESEEKDREIIALLAERLV